MVPVSPKIYHIVHWDRLESIIRDGQLWCDREIVDRHSAGTTIGMDAIKKRRLSHRLFVYPELCVGDCVPFYFCPRSIMLYLFYQNNHPDLSYRGGQNPIVHLEADFREVVNWARSNRRRFLFTGSNAGSNFFEEFADPGELDKLDWNAIQNNNWKDPTVKDRKQAEFLLERSFPWGLIRKVGVRTSDIRDKVLSLPGWSLDVLVQPDWYY